MTDIVKPSFCSRYICNIKFFLLLVSCVLLIIGGIYYVYHRLDESKNATIWKNNNSTHINSKENLTAPIEWSRNEEIQIFREYLQIPSVHPNINYEPCVEFLKRQARSLNLSVQVYYPVNDKNPVVVITWNGTQPELPSIMLNSHMDVVPVFEEYWTHPPFAAEIDENGNIFARGAQDTKSIGTQYLAAVRALMREGIKQLKRTVHIVFVPDEEIKSKFGMAGFVKTPEFQRLNVGFMLDEGVVTDQPNKINVFYAEKAPWKVQLIIHGESGHGSLLLKNTAGEKMNYIVNKFMEMRQSEMWKEDVLKYPKGSVTSINLTIVKGGIQPNVIPAEISVIFDVRFAIDADMNEFEKQVEQWCKEAGGNITINYPQKEPKAVATAIDASNPFWTAFARSFKEFNVEIVPSVLFGATDARFVRSLNIPALGFSPSLNTTPLFHAHNEYLNANIYLFGIKVYQRVIQNLANV